MTITTTTVTTEQVSVPVMGETFLPGRDHRSLLLFLQWIEASCCGNLHIQEHRIRSRERDYCFGHRMEWKAEYGTRYDDGRVDGNHDDFDCLADLERWGYLCTIPERNKMSGYVKLTDKGHDMVRMLVRSRNERELNKVACDLFLQTHASEVCLIPMTPQAKSELIRRRFLNEGEDSVRMNPAEAWVLATAFREMGMSIREEVISIREEVIKKDAPEAVTESP